MLLTCVHNLEVFKKILLPQVFHAINKGEIKGELLLKIKYLNVTQF